LNSDDINITIKAKSKRKSIFGQNFKPHFVNINKTDEENDEEKPL
jgi:hypothetical protein